VIQAFSLDDMSLDAAWLTVGIFDGVHIGHQLLLARLAEGAHRSEAKAVVLTFNPHPAIVLGGREDFKTLTTPGERAALLESLGVDVVITQHFDRSFASQSAADFMRRLMQTLELRHLVLGHDTALGHDREGDAARLTQLGRELGYTVEVVKPLRQGRTVVSSSAIRSLVHEGSVEEAARLLGRPFFLSGWVVHGDGRGRHINIPTANIECPNGKFVPANGIYATWTWVDEERYLGATNIGTNPTFNPEKQAPHIETHILEPRSARISSAHAPY